MMSKTSKPHFNGFTQECALFYVSKKGIMTNYNYPFLNGKPKDTIYNVSITTPIGVRNINLQTITSIQYLKIQLKAGAMLVSYNTDEVSCNNWHIDDVIENVQPNHAVMGVNLWQCSDVTDEHYSEVYLMFQNSWGKSCGNGGYFYIRITENNGTDSCP